MPKYMSQASKSDRYKASLDYLKLKTKQATLPRLDKTRYQPRKGLEGPFMTKSGQVVYYDKTFGQYYNSDTDMYIDYDDWKKMNEDAPANATGTAVAGTGDDSSTVIVKKKKPLQDKLMRRMGIKEAIDRAVPDLEYEVDEITARANQLKEMAINKNDKSDIQAKKKLPYDKDTDRPKKYVAGLSDKEKKSHDRHLAKQGKSVPGQFVQGYLPAAKMLDDIVQAGPAYINLLRALHQRAKKSRK